MRIFSRNFLEERFTFVLADKDQEVDLEPRGGGVDSDVRSVEGSGAEGRVMCTIRGVGNKSLNHINSVPALQNKVRPSHSQAQATTVIFSKVSL